MSEIRQCENDAISFVRNGMDIINEKNIEISYEDDFDTDVVETEDCIEYKTRIGPNIVVAKNPSRSDQSIVLTSDISVAPRNMKKDKSILLSQTRGHTHQNQRTLAIRHTTPQSALRDSIRKLHLGFNNGKSNNCKNSTGISLHIRKCSGTLQLQPKTSNSSLMAYPVFVPDGSVQRRLNSATKLQVKDLMSKVRQLENTIEDIKIENRTLRMVHHRQDLALRKYEGADADLPKMLRHHRNEVHCLQTNLRKINSRSRNYEETMRSMNQKIIKLEQENKRLIRLVADGNLEERHDLNEQLNAMSFHADRREEKLHDFSRHIEILEKNHLHQINVENGKLRNSNKKLFDSNQEVDRLKDLIRQKDRIINYLRIRTCRNPDLEPPILKQMLRSQNERFQRINVHESQNISSASRPQTPKQRNMQTYRKTYSFAEGKERERRGPETNEARQKDESSSSEASEESPQSYSYSSRPSLPKDSGSVTVEEPINRVSQKQDSSSEEDEEYVTEEEYEIDIAEKTGEIEKKLDHDNIDPYYHFESINEEDLSVYTPKKSLYLDALESSCNVSSLNSPHTSTVILGKNSGDGEPATPLKETILVDIPPPIAFADARKTATDLDVQKPDTNIIGAAGDGSGNLAELNKLNINKGEVSLGSFHFYTKTESGFISQRSEIIPSAEKVRLAQLRARWSRPSAHVVSESSDSHEEDEEVTEKEEDDLDNKLPIENMKMHFKVPKSSDRNLKNSNSFKDAARLSNIFREIILQEETKPETPELPKISFPTIEFGSSPRNVLQTSMELGNTLNPKVKSPNMSIASATSILSDRSPFTKIGASYTKGDLLSHKIEIPLVRIEKQIGAVVGNSKKSSRFAALESSLFTDSPTTMSSKVKRNKSFFENMPSPPPTSTKHFDFEYASIFQKQSTDLNQNKTDQLTTPLKNSEEKNEIPKRAYHDNLTTTFQKKNLQQHQQHVSPQKTSSISSAIGSASKKCGAWK